MCTWVLVGCTLLMIYHTYRHLELWVLTGIYTFYKKDFNARDKRNSTSYFHQFNFPIGLGGHESTKFVNNILIITLLSITSSISCRHMLWLHISCTSKYDLQRNKRVLDDILVVLIPATFLSHALLYHTYTVLHHLTFRNSKPAICYCFSVYPSCAFPWSSVIHTISWTTYPCRLCTVASRISGILYPTLTSCP